MQAARPLQPASHPAAHGDAMRTSIRVLAALIVVYYFSLSSVLSQSTLGREVAIPRHLQDGEEFEISLRALLIHGQRLFAASWTIEEGGGRPLTKGTGTP